MRGRVCHLGHLKSNWTKIPKSVSQEAMFHTHTQEPEHKPLQVFSSLMFVILEHHSYFHSL